MEQEIKKSDKKLKGLGGWLIFVCIGMFVNSLRALENIGTNNDILNDKNLHTVEKSMRGFSALIGFDSLISKCLLIALICLIILFFEKSVKFPKYYIGFMIASVIVGAIEYCFLLSLDASSSVWQIKSQLLSAQTSNMITAILGAIVWGLYMKKSIRVKNTFTN